MFVVDQKRTNIVGVLFNPRDYGGFIPGFV